MHTDVIGFVRKSRNAKTGPIPVSVSRRVTCPSTCPLRHSGCYAHEGFLRFHWARLENGTWGIPWEEFLQEIEALPEGTFWRHAQAGDLPGRGTAINRKKLRELTKANRGKKGYTYTHKPPNPGNLSAVREACKGGFIINLSADGLSMADKLFDSGLPVATLLPEKWSAPLKTPRGRRVVVCPAQARGRSSVTCDDCRLCARGDRNFIIGFLPHGRKAPAVRKVASSN